MEEHKLISRARKGDDAAFEALIERYRAKIYAICLRILCAEQDAQDAAQEAMIKMYCSINRYNFRSTFATWAYTIARNTALDHLRMLKRSRNESYDELAAQGAAIFDIDDITAESVERNDLSGILRDLVNQLPKDMRNCLILKDIDGYSCEDIAVILNQPIGTVKSRLHRARARLMELIRKNGLEL